jgi:integrase
MAKIWARKNGYKYLTYNDIDGKRYSISTGTKDPKKAIYWKYKAEELLDQARRGLISKVGRINGAIVANRKMKINSPTIDEFCEKWLTKQDESVKQLANSTIGNTTTALKSLVKVIGNKKLTDIENSDVIKWQKHWLANGLSQTTVGIYHRHLRAAFNFAKENNPTGTNWFELIPEVKAIKNKNKEDSMQPNDVKKLIKTVKDNGYHWFSTYLLFQFNTGCRRNEILFLRWEDINLEAGIHGVLTINAQKTKRRFQIPINKALREIINGMQKKKVGYVFQTECRLSGILKKDQPWNPDYVSHLFKKFVVKANLPNFQLKHTRHTYATLLIQRGATYAAAAKLLGHASPQTTARYYDHVSALEFGETADLIDFKDE